MHAHSTNLDLARVVAELYRAGPAPLRELERLHGQRLTDRARRLQWVRPISTTIGALYVLDGAGREALGLDRGYLPPPEAAVEGLTRRLARDVLRGEGWRSSDADAPIPFGPRRPTERAYWREEAGGAIHSCSVLATPWDPPAGTLQAAIGRLDATEELLVFAWHPAAIRHALEGQGRARAQVQAWTAATPRLSPPLRRALARLEAVHAPAGERA